MSRYTYQDYEATITKFELIKEKVYNTSKDGQFNNNNLIKLAEFIETNEIVGGIIQEAISKVPDYNYLDEYYTEKNSTYYTGGMGVRSKEYRTEKIIKATYDFLIEATDEFYDNTEFFEKIKYNYDRNGNITEYVTSWFKELFEHIKPILYYNHAKLKEDTIKEINNDNRKYEFRDISNSDISLATDGSTITINNNNIQEIVKLMQSLKTPIEQAEDIPEEVKQEIQEDLEIVEEELKKEEPNKKKIVERLKGLGEFCKDSLKDWYKTDKPKKLIIEGLVDIIGGVLDNKDNDKLVEPEVEPPNSVHLRQGQENLKF